jgi:hypothetical protein
MSHLNLEQIVEAIDALPPDEQEQVRQKLNERKSGRNSPLPPGFETRRLPPTGAQVKGIAREMAWIEQHRDEYAGQWVALDGERLIKAGRSAKEVHDAARAESVPDALIVKVIPRNRLQFADIVTVADNPDRP